MADSDEEQIEAIKRWWSENGTSLIVTAVLAVGGVLGYQAWENHVQTTGEAAAKIYGDLLDAVVVEGPFETPDPEALQTGGFLGKQLKDEYGGSSYAHLASMFLARLAVDRGELEVAASELRWSLDNGVDESLKPIVAMRLARVQNGLGEHEQALQTLVSVEPGEHLPSWAEIRGDIYLAMGDEQQARESYQEGINALANPGARPMLQMKLDDLEAPSLTVPLDGDDPLASVDAETDEAEDTAAP